MVPSVAPPLGAQEGWLHMWFRATDGRPFSIPMFYAYVLESLDKPGEFYRDHTEDLKRRMVPSVAPLLGAQEGWLHMWFRASAFAEAMADGTDGRQPSGPKSSKSQASKHQRSCKHQA
jgi:hypothetical protein